MKQPTVLYSYTQTTTNDLITNSSKSPNPKTTSISVMVSLIFMRFLFYSRFSHFLIPTATTYSGKSWMF